MKRDTFFSQPNCSRCGKELRVRIMSWFTEETICMACHNNEVGLRQMIRKAGLESKYPEGCGHMPTIIEIEMKQAGAKCIRQ